MSPSISPAVPALVPTAIPTSPAEPAQAPRATVDWSRVRLGVDPAPTMFVAHWAADTGRWDGGSLVPYGPLSLLPAAQVLNYGQSIFEGLKAYRADSPLASDAHDGASGTEPAARDATATASTSGNGDGGSSGGEGGKARVLLFRPEANAARFAAGAERMCMPPVPPAMFLAALHAVVRANEAWVPPPSRGSLYLRPLLLGTGPLLGLCPAPSYTFVLYAVPVGGRAKAGRLAPLDYLIHDSLHRAAPRGVGSTKAAGNYSPCLQAQAEARRQGCADCIYLDARSDTYLEEGSGCNVFAARGGLITTPPAAGSILPGVTRASLLTLAAALGYGVAERPISVPDAMQADEMFASGTAVVVQPIGSITYKGQRVDFCSRAADPHPHPQQQGQQEQQQQGAVQEAEAQSSQQNHQQSCHQGDGTDGGSAHGAHAPALSSPSPSQGVNGCGSGCENGFGSADGYGYGGRGAGELSAEQRAALAAAAPPPTHGSLPPGVGPLAQRLYTLLTGIQYGRAPDVFGWMMPVAMEGPTEGPLHLDELLGEEEEEEEEEDEQAEEEGAEGPVHGRAVVTVNGHAGGSANGHANGHGPAAAKAKARAPHLVFADPNLE